MNEAEFRHYGNGFVVAPKWKGNIIKYWKVSERISVIQFRLKNEEYTSQVMVNVNIGLRFMRKKDKKLLTVINVYAPTAKRVQENPAELDALYMH